MRADRVAILKKRIKFDSLVECQERRLAFLAILCESSFISCFSTQIWTKYRWYGHHSSLICVSSDMQPTSIWNHSIHSFLRLPCRTSPPFLSLHFLYFLIVSGTSHCVHHHFLVFSLITSFLAGICDINHTSAILHTTSTGYMQSTFISNCFIHSFVLTSPTLTFSLLPFHSPASHRLRVSYS